VNSVSLSHHGETLVVGSMRIVEGVGMRDPVSAGEELARYAPGEDFSAIRAEVVRLASENRGVDYSIDVVNSLGFQPMWCRFLSVSYEAGWIVTPRTGIIESKPEVRSPRSVGELVATDRAKFEAARDKAKTKHARQQNRGQGKAAKTATNH